jgi:hypothetical protein
LIGSKYLAILSFEEKMKMSSLVLFLFVISVGAASALRVGVDHMRNPLINRGLATSPAERKLKGLSGLMPGQLFTFTNPPVSQYFPFLLNFFSQLNNIPVYSWSKIFQNPRSKCPAPIEKQENRHG